MNKKIYVPLILLILLAIVLIGVGYKSWRADAVVKNFYEKHCNLIFEKRPDMLAGWADNAQECTQKFIEQDEQYDQICESLPEGKKMNCNEARKNRLSEAREGVTKTGCLKNQKGFNCFIWDLEGNKETWAQASAEQQAEGKREFDKCMTEAESYCSVFPDNVSY